MVKRRFFAGFVVVLAFLLPAGRCLGDVSAQLEQAEGYADEGQYEQAEAGYKQIVAENPGADAALKAQEKLTILYVEQEKSQEAEAAYQQLITGFAQNAGLPKALDHVADAYREIKHYVEARGVYEYIVNNWPQAEHAVDSQRGVVLCYFLLGDDPNTEAAFGELVTRFSGHKKLARTVDHLADDLREIGKYDKARGMYMCAVEQWPDSKEAIGSQAGVVRTSILLGDDAGAEAALESLLEVYAENEGLAKEIDQLADDYREARKYEKAKSLYKYIVANWPDSERAAGSQAGAVRCAILMRDDPNAQAELDKLLADYSTSEGMAKTLDQVADEFRRANKYDKARGMYMYAVEQWPDSKEAIGSQAGVVRASILLGDDAGAEAALQSLLEVYAENEGLAKEIDQLADDYREARKYEKAKSLYKYIVANWPDSERAAGSQAGAVRCAILMRDDPNAEAELNKLLEDYSASEGIDKAVDLVADEYRRAKNYDKAREIYTYVIEHYPNSGRLMESIRGLAMANVGAGDDPNTEAQLDKLTGEFSADLAVAKALYEVAAKYVEAKRYEQAGSIYERIIEDYPQSEQANKAELDVRKTAILALIVEGSDDSKVEEAVSAIIADFKGHAYLPRVLSDIAKRYFYRLRYQQAIELWELVLNDYPDSPVNGEVAYFLGACHERGNDWQKAVEYYKVTVEKYPASRYAEKVPHKIGLLYRFGGQPDEALHWLAKQRELYPDPLCAQRALFEQGAVYHYDLKDYEKAIEVFEEYLSEYPDDEHTWPAYSSMALCYEKMGNKEQAIGVLEQALEQFAGTTEADRIVVRLENMRKGAE